jgi:diketogulonate reductase-like aldo/keto reductase
LNQKKLMEFCKDRKIFITAYSPLGSPDRPWAKPEDPQLLDDEKLKGMAKKLNRSPAQVVLRYQVGFFYHEISRILIRGFPLSVATGQHHHPQVGHQVPHH